MAEQTLRARTWIRVHWREISWAGLPVILVLGLSVPGDMRDTGAYYGATLDNIYRNSTFLHTGYVYSPAFSLLAEPFRWFPIQVMQGAIRIGDTLALAYLVTPWLGAAMILVDFPGVRASLGAGDIGFIVGALMVWVLWRPWLWPALLLTKVSPGVGLAWHLARREWRALGIALGVTALLILVTLPFMWSAWFDWVGVLTGSNVGIAEAYTGLPLIPRLLFGACIAGVAGLLGWSWLVPLAVAVSYPNPNLTHWLVLFASLRLALGRAPVPNRDLLVRHMQTSVTGDAD